MSPNLSFVCISDRPDALRLLIASLRLQTCASWELLVLDQSPDRKCLRVVSEVELLGDKRVVWYSVPRVGDWGQSMKFDYTHLALGEFVAYPNDDAYYVPAFVEQMLAHARGEGLGIVYCDWLFDKFGYRAMDGRPVVGRIDVGGFIVRRDLMIADGWTDRGDTGDGLLVQRICEKYSHGRVPGGVLYVKN